MLTAGVALVLALVPRLADSPPAAAEVAGIAAAGETRILVQNPNAEMAMAAIDFYRSGAGISQSLALPPIAPSAVLAIEGNDLPLPSGAYAAVLNTDRDVNAGALLRWPASGGAIGLTAPRGSMEVWVPGVVRDVGGRSSLLTIQNTDVNAAVMVNVAVTALDASAPAANPTFNVPPGTSIILDLGQDLEWASLGGGFAGSARVQAPGPVAVEHIMDFTASAKAVAGSAGIAIGDTSDALSAPFVAAAAQIGGGGPILTTSIGVVNRGTSSAEVTVTYYGAAGSCLGQTFTHPPRTVPASGGTVFDQSPGSAGAVLPSGCIARGHISTVGSMLAATVLVTSSGDETAAAYEAQSAGQAATELVTSMWHHDADGWTTAIVVGNASSQPADVTVGLTSGSSGALACGAPCTATVAPNASHMFWLGGVPGLVAGDAGWATISSTAAVSAVALQVPWFGGGWDLVATVAQGAGDVVNLVPLILLEGGGGPASTPTPTAFATATPDVPPTATPDVPVTPTPTAFFPTPTPFMPGTATPTPLGPGPTDTPAVTATPPPVSTATPLPLPTATPAGAGGPGAPEVDPRVVGRVPVAAVNAALADPSRVRGWGVPRNRNLPWHPVFNPFRTCLSLRNPASPYHPLFNGLEFKAGCP
jgi:hypothetical protein